MLSDLDGVQVHPAVCQAGGLYPFVGVLAVQRCLIGSGVGVVLD